jgi:hypothetical protein
LRQTFAIFDQALARFFSHKMALDSWLFFAKLGEGGVTSGMRPCARYSPSMTRVTYQSQDERGGVMNKAVAAVMAAMLLAGCASSPQKVDPATVASFQPGVTTVAQVEAALGPPFQASRMPDGSQQLQYVSKYQEVSGDGLPTTGSQIPKRVEKTVSTVLRFDQDGHFLSSSSNAKTKDNQWPSNLGNLGSGDMKRNAGQ